MQYFQHPEHIPAEQIIADYDRMMELIEWTDDLALIGGEPFVYPDLEKVLQAVGEHPMTNKKVGCRYVITNGTILPSETVFDALAKYGFEVCISNYREKSKHLLEIVQACFRHNIPCRILPLMYWINISQMAQGCTQKSERELLAMRQRGCYTRCRTVADGRFYLCTFHRSLRWLKAVPGGEQDSVCLQDDNAREKIAKLLDMDRPLPSVCSYCTGCGRWDGESAALRFPPAEQAKQPLPYEKFEK